VPIETLIETVRLIFMMAFCEPQDLKWVSVSVGFRIDDTGRIALFMNPSIYSSIPVHL